jgi:hypothetical protein
MENAFCAAYQGGAMAVGVYAITSCLNTEELDGRVFGKGVEHADRVASTTNAGYDRVGEFTSLLEHLGASLVADHGLEGSDDCGEGVGTDG